MIKLNKKKVKALVKEAYGKIAKGQNKDCGCGCGTCGSKTGEFAKTIGYSEAELKATPDNANLALGCGNPTALAGLKKGDTVLDLGSGAGFDCFLAASKVGSNGKVIGVDMTPEMIERARDNAKKNQIKNVEFRVGEIEKLPIDSNSIDVIISNCVINLSTDKLRVFQEIHRVLKSGGHMAISDIALLKELPDRVRENIKTYVGCIGGAMLVSKYKKVVESSGFRDVKISVQSSSACIDSNTKDPMGKALLNELGVESLQGYIVSIYVEGNK